MATPARPAAKGALSWLRNKILHSVGFGLVLMLVAGVVIFKFSDFRKPHADVVRIAYSSGGAVRKHFLEEMVSNGKKQNLDIRLIPTEGADATLALIDKHGAEMGLIAGAIEDRAKRRVLEISPLYMEPLQLVVKAEIFDAVSHDFGALKGKTISMNGDDSATSILATELLRFIGLHDHATGQPLYRPSQMRESDVLREKDTAALPDAIFQIGGVPSGAVEDLVTNHNYRLVALPFGGAFNLSKFRESGPATVANGARLGLNKTFIEEAVIPAYVYGVLPAVPATDTRTIATRLTLIGDTNLSNEIVQRVLAEVMSPEVSNVVQPQLTPKLLDTEFLFPRHPGADAYLESLKPFNVDGAFDNYQRMAEIWGILVALYFAGTNGWKWVRERRDRKRRHSVGDYMGQVLEVEAGAHAATSDADRRALDQRLSDIKKEAIELHLDDRLEDADNLQSLLVTLADARTRIWGMAT